MSFHAASLRSCELPFGMISDAPPIGTALRTFLGMKATLKGAFMFWRMKDKEPVDETIIADLPAEEGVVHGGRLDRALGHHLELVHEVIDESQRAEGRGRVVIDLPAPIAGCNIGRHSKA